MDLSTKLYGMEFLVTKFHKFCSHVDLGAEVVAKLLQTVLLRTRNTKMSNKPPI